MRILCPPFQSCQRHEQQGADFHILERFGQQSAEQEVAATEVAQCDEGQVERGWPYAGGGLSKDCPGSFSGNDSSNRVRRCAE